MDIYESAFVDLWDKLNRNGVRYIMVGGFATNLHGYHRLTEDIDLYIEDTLENRRKLRKTFKDIGLGDFEPIERIQFIPGWVDFQLDNGVRIDIMCNSHNLNQQIGNTSQSYKSKVKIIRCGDF